MAVRIVPHFRIARVSHRSRLGVEPKHAAGAIATSNGASSFAYDALGRHTSRTISATTTSYLRDGTSPVLVNGDLMINGLGLDEFYASVASSGVTSRHANPAIRNWKHVPMSNEDLKLTHVTISRLLRYLSYPSDWLQNGLYPDGLARLQLKEVLEHLQLEQVVFERLPDADTYGSGSEHFRAAAILYWLRRSRPPEITAALKVALENDPDKPMARAFLRELEAQKPTG